MKAQDGISEELLTDALAAGWDRRSAPMLLIGVQRRETVQAANAVAGAASVRLLHLDRAAGAVGCGLGNPESMLGDSDDAGAGPLTAGTFAVVGLNVEAARSYRLLREIVGQAAALVHQDGCLLIAGPRKGGAEVAAAVLRARFETVDLETHRKGHRVYRACRPRASAMTAEEPLAPATAEDLLTVHLRGQTLHLVQDARIFARGLLDPASRMLAETFTVPPGADVLDLGCGGGVLGILAALLDPTAACTLVDSDPLAVAAARRGAVLSGAANVRVQLSDVLADLPGQTFDVVLMNPPFHRGRMQDRSLGERFLIEASAALRPCGSLWVVCNRFLPYERTLAEALKVPREVTGDRAYKVLTAKKPRAV